MPYGLLFSVLQILRQVRKLPWGDPEVYQWAVTSLIQIWHVKYNNIHLHGQPPRWTQVLPGTL